MKKFVVIFILCTIFSEVLLSMQGAAKMAEEAMQLFRANDTLGAIRLIKKAYMLDSSDPSVRESYALIISKRDSLIKNVIMNAEFFYTRGKMDKAMKYYQMVYEFDSGYPGIESRLTEIAKILGSESKVSDMIAKNSQMQQSSDTILVSTMTTDQTVSVDELYSGAVSSFEGKDYFHCLKALLPILVTRPKFKDSESMALKCIKELEVSQSLYSIGKNPVLHHGIDSVFNQSLYDATIIRENISELRVFSVFIFYHTQDYGKYNNLVNSCFKFTKDPKILAALLFTSGKRALSERNYYAAAGRFFASNELSPNFPVYYDFAYSYIVHYKTYFIVSLILLFFSLILFLFAVQLGLHNYNKEQSAFEKASAAYREGHYDKSLQLLEGMSKSKQFDNLEVFKRYLQGMIHVQKNDLKKAIAVFQQCKKEEFFVEPYINLAVLYGLVGDKDKVMTELRMCLQQVAEAYFRRKHVVGIGVMDYHRIVSQESDPHIELLFSTITKLMRY